MMLDSEIPNSIVVIAFVFMFTASAVWFGTPVLFIGMEKGNALQILLGISILLADAAIIIYAIKIIEH